jgi:hypothetical protein
MMMIGLMNEVLRLEFQQLINLISHVVDCLECLFFKNFYFLILHLHVFDLLEFLIKLLVEGVQDCCLESECATADGKDTRW